MVSILVGTEEGFHVLADGSPGLVEMAGHDVGALAQVATEWWAIADGREVWSSEGGGQWRQRAAGPTGVRLNCLAIVPDGLLVGTSEAHLFQLADGLLRPVEGFEEVAGRAEWYTPWGGPPDSRSIAVGLDGAVYVNVHVGGIVRSLDGGGSWEPTIDIDSDVHQVSAIGERPGEVRAATALGLAVSRDSGDTWTFQEDGLHGSYCRAVAVSAETLLVSASEGHRGRRAAVYRTGLDRSGPFVKCADGLPEWFGSNIDSHCLAALGSSVAFGTDDGEVFLSEDSGETWTPAASGLPPVRCLALA